MAESRTWSLPARARPQPELLQYDLDAALRSMVLLRTEASDEAYTAGVLGTDRLGNGVMISASGRAVVLTIGYLIVEAEQIWLTNHAGQVVQGHALAYDYVTGFGLVQPLGSLTAPPLALGSSAALAVGDELTVIAHGGHSHCLSTRLTARHEFAGYWEYLLEDALFTAPAHPLWGGTSLLNARGELVGLGSLMMQQQRAGKNEDINMFLPIDLLASVQGELLQHGALRRPARPWLGIYSSEADGKLQIAGLVKDGPAHSSGVRLGDLVVAVAGERVTTLGQFYRALWSQGNAGCKIPLSVERDGAAVELQIATASREQYLIQPQRH